MCSSLAAEGTTFVDAPQSLGVQLIPLATSFPLAAGTIPAGGVLDLQVPLAGIRNASARIFVQAYFSDAGDQEYAATQIALARARRELLIGHGGTTPPPFPAAHPLFALPE